MERQRTDADVPTLASAICPLPSARRTVLRNVLLPIAAGYARKDVLLNDGKIESITECVPGAAQGTDEVDCTERLLLPGFVNAHTHSIEHWARGLIKPLPLELWVQQLIRHEPRGDEGWNGRNSFMSTPPEAVALSAMHCGVEALLSGCTAILDHLFVRHLDDLQAAVTAYKALGIRAFIALMLNDDASMYENYIPLATDAAARNIRRNERKAHGGDAPCCAMGEGGCFRTACGQSDPSKTAAMLALWEEAVQRFHDPANGIDIVIGPVTAYSASSELLRGATALRSERLIELNDELMEPDYMMSRASVLPPPLHCLCSASDLSTCLWRIRMPLTCPSCA